MPGFEVLQRLMELQVIRIAKPATQQAQVPVRNLVGFPVDVIARLIQIQPIAILKFRGRAGSGWMRSAIDKLF